MKETVHESIVPVIERINAAEKAAEEITAEAETRAADIKRACAAEIETMEKEYSAQMKKLVAETLANAEAEGNKQAEVLLGEAKKECDAIAEKAKARRARVTKYVVDKILGGAAD